MKTFDFIKHNGEVASSDAMHAWLDRQLKWLRNGHHVLVLKSVARRRSTAQNRLMWLWFACLEQEFGQQAMDWHDYYCLLFLPRDIINPSSGEMMRVGGHTSNLTVEAFSDFLDKVQADAATEFGVTLPSPDDESWGDFETKYKVYVNE